MCNYDCGNCKRIENGLMCVLSPFYEEKSTDLDWSVQAKQDEVM